MSELKYADLEPELKVDAENEAVRWSILLDRTIEPETVWEYARAKRLIDESDDFPVIEGKALKLKSSMHHIILAVEVAREVEGKAVHEVAAAIHALACVVAEGASKGRKFSPKRVRRRGTSGWSRSKDEL